MQTISVRGRVFNYSHTIGRNSDAGTGFRYPVALARGNGDLLYVLNRGDEYTNSQRVTVMTLDEEFIRDIGSMGERDGQFIWPTAIDVDSDGNIFVADEWLNRMTIFDPEGNFLDRWGTPGPKEGQLNGPSGLVIDSTNNVYITDELSHRVQKFTRDGVYLSSWGRKGSGEGQLQNPWGITVDSDDNLYVADWRNNRVQKVSREREFIKAFGRPGSGKGEFMYPTDVAVDKDGDVYVTDWWNSKVEIYDSEGEHLTTFGGDAEPLSEWAQMSIKANPDIEKARLRVKSLEPERRFFRPVAVEVDDCGRILVADTLRCRIQIYRKEKGWTEPQFNL